MVLMEKYNVWIIFNYWDDLGDGLFLIFIFIGEGKVMNKRLYFFYEFIVMDIIGDEDDYCLDIYGF